MLRERDVMTYNVAFRARKTSHEYGIEMPTHIEYAKRVDDMNRTFYRNIWH